MVKRLILVLFLLNVTTVAYADQDPTAPLGWIRPEGKAPVKQRQVRKRPPLPALQSIICKQSIHCSAVLNNKLLSAGESVRGYRVVSISQETVTLSRGGRKWTLELFPVDIKHERLQK